jgi:hypothetical protein
MSSDLERRRDRLSRQYVDAQWNLGGLAYEMAIRDHFRLDVLTKRAAELQQLDAELGEVERMLKLDHAGAAGACPNCGALYAQGSAFCWQCGKSLMPSGQQGAAAPPQQTQPIPPTQPTQPQ